MIAPAITPAYAALTWTSISGIALATSAVLALGVVVIKTGRSPLTLLQLAALRLQGEWMWAVGYAWPAVRRERHQIDYCIAKAARRVVEKAPPIASREPVAVERFTQLPGSARSGLLDWLAVWLRRTA
jgi:hypothetical protein